MSRQKTGYRLTVAAVTALAGCYLAALALFYQEGDKARTFLGASVTVLPLLYLLPGAWRENAKAYAALALLAPLHLFFGGVIWLWEKPGWGMWICVWAVILQTGTILHNYIPRGRRKSRS